MKEDPIKSEIKKAMLEKAPAEFASVVMKEITEAEDEAVINPALRALLNRHGLESAPAGFQENVMAQVRVYDFKPAFRPVITGRAWSIMAIILALFVVFTLSLDQGGPVEPGLTSYVIQLGSKLTAVFMGIPPLYLITFSLVAVLLFADYLVNKLRRTTP